jgi:Transglycosylase-like domain
LRYLQLCTAALVSALALVTTMTAPTPAGAQRSSLLRPGNEFLLAPIERKRNETWRWQRLMRQSRTSGSNNARRSVDPAYRRWVLRLWTKRARRARILAANPPRKTAWQCIYRHERHPEQGWATRTGNGYYGGLQMDVAFQARYGPELLRRKGTADRWTAVEQMWIAERAYRSGQGFYPWPETARACGLI